MNDLQAARRVAELCLAEDRPLADELRPFNPGAADAAAAGDLGAALDRLDFDRDLGRLAAARPAALLGAGELLARLPSPAAVRVPLVQTALWFCLIALVQLGVLLLILLKVRPVIAKMAADHELAASAWSMWSGTALALGGAALVVVALVGARGPVWLPGWGRSLRSAREAALAAALVASKPPEDVLSAWLRQSPSLQQAPITATAADLAALARSEADRAEQQMQRFVIVYRYAGFALLTAVALGITVDVYAGCASLAGIR